MVLSSLPTGKQWRKRLCYLQLLGGLLEQQQEEGGGQDPSPAPTLSFVHGCLRHSHAYVRYVFHFHTRTNH